MAQHMHVSLTQAQLFSSAGGGALGAGAPFSDWAPSLPVSYEHRHNRTNKPGSSEITRLGLLAMRCDCVVQSSHEGSVYLVDTRSSLMCGRTSLKTRKPSGVRCPCHELQHYMLHVAFAWHVQHWGTVNVSGWRKRILFFWEKKNISRIAFHHFGHVEYQPVPVIVKNLKWIYFDGLKLHWWMTSQQFLCLQQSIPDLWK